MCRDPEPDTDSSFNTIYDRIEEKKNLIYEDDQKALKRSGRKISWQAAAPMGSFTFLHQHKFTVIMVRSQEIAMRHDNETTMRRRNTTTAEEQA